MFIARSHRVPVFNSLTYYNLLFLPFYMEEMLEPRNAIFLWISIRNLTFMRLIHHTINICKEHTNALTNWVISACTAFTRHGWGPPCHMSTQVVCYHRCLEFNLIGDQSATACMLQVTLFSFLTEREIMHCLYVFAVLALRTFLSVNSVLPVFPPYWACGLLSKKSSRPPLQNYNDMVIIVLIQFKERVSWQMQNRKSPGACVKVNRFSGGRIGAVATSRQMLHDVNWENTRYSGTYEDKVGGEGLWKGSFLIDNFLLQVPEPSSVRSPRCFANTWKKQKSKTNHCHKHTNSPWLKRALLLTVVDFTSPPHPWMFIPVGRCGGN